MYSRFDPTTLKAPRNQNESYALALASMHPNGRVRERACRLSDGKRLPYLLIRLNDWVPQVRAAAREALELGLGAPAESWVDCLPLLERLKGWGRDDHGPFVERVLQRLAQPDASAAIISGLDSADRTTRRLCYKIALPCQWTSSGLLLRALKDNDIFIRRWAVNSAKILPAALQEALVKTALKNSAPLVRHEALLEWRKLHPDGHQPFWDALLDRSRSIREYARYVLKGQQLQEYYLKRIDSNPLAVLGLVECGFKAEEKVRTNLYHPQYSFRKQALKALGHLGKGEDTFLDFLASEDWRLSGVAMRELCKRRFNRQAVQRIIETSEHFHCRKNAATLLINNGRWYERDLTAARLCFMDGELGEFARERVHSMLHELPPPYSAPDEFKDQVRELLSAADWGDLAQSFRFRYGIAER